MQSPVRYLFNDLNVIRTKSFILRGAQQISIILPKSEVGDQGSSQDFLNLPAVASSVGGNKTSVTVLDVCDTFTKGFPCHL